MVEMELMILVSSLCCGNGGVSGCVVSDSGTCEVGSSGITTTSSITSPKTATTVRPSLTQ